MEDSRPSTSGGHTSHPPQPAPDDHCPICLSDFKKPTYVPSCRHWFCFRCIRRWADATRNPSCPLCKQQMDKVMHWPAETTTYEEYVVGLPPRMRRMMNIERARNRIPQHSHELRSRSRSNPSSADRRSPNNSERGYNLRSRFVEFTYYAPSALRWRETRGGMTRRRRRRRETE